jgi:hypothetical protein
MKECRWITPKLVCQVAFVEWTDAGHLRFRVGTSSCQECMGAAPSVARVRKVME